MGHMLASIRKSFIGVERNAPRSTLIAELRKVFILLICDLGAFPQIGRQSILGIIIDFTTKMIEAVLVLYLWEERCLTTPIGLESSVFSLDMCEFHLYLLLIVSPSILRVSMVGIVKSLICILALQLCFPQIWNIWHLSLERTEPE